MMVLNKGNHLLTMFFSSWRKLPQGVTSSYTKQARKYFNDESKMFDPDGLLIIYGIFMTDYLVSSLQAHEDG